MQWWSTGCGRPVQRAEEWDTWASRTQKGSEAGGGRPQSRGVWAAKNCQTTPAATSTTLVRQLLGTANAQAAPAATSTAPVHQRWGGRGDKTTPKWGIKPPPTPFLAIFDPWGGFMPPGGGGGVIPPFRGGGFIPSKGWFYPHKRGWFYSFIGSLGGDVTPFGWFYPPFSVGLSPHGVGCVGGGGCHPLRGGGVWPISTST